MNWDSTRNPARTRSVVGVDFSVAWLEHWLRRERLCGCLQADYYHGQLLEGRRNLMSSIESDRRARGALERTNGAKPSRASRFWKIHSFRNYVTAALIAAGEASRGAPPATPLNSVVSNLYSFDCHLVKRPVFDEFSLIKPFRRHVLIFIFHFLYIAIPGFPTFQDERHNKLDIRARRDKNRQGALRSGKMDRAC